VHVWARELPEGALSQLTHIASQPYVVEHVAAMPDLHVANGVAVGTVFATEGTIVPSALGGDLGCGMSAIRFDVPASTLGRSELERLLVELTRVIPVGDATHRGKGTTVPDTLLETPLSTGALEHARERLAPRHLGTLGGGNHFLELDRDAGGNLWLLVHTGSRGLGAAVAAHHLRVAETFGVGTIPGIPADTEAARACLSDLNWTLAFAKANRDRLIERACELVDASADLESRVDVHHNFAREETHFGRTLLVHRKGAIAAPRGERALIPGSMATASYLVEGLGEPLSFASASHGAGRVLTRKQARAQVRPHRLVHAMRRVVFDARRAASLVEEAPEAYRDVREVLDDEADLVTPRLRLEPIAVLKG
jgi:tRNA-splicing ligase RtcB